MIVSELPSLPFPNAFASPCSASLHFVDPFSAPLRPVRVSSSPLLRSHRSVRIVLLEREGGRGRRTERGGKRGKRPLTSDPSSLVRISLSLSLSFLARRIAGTRFAIRLASRWFFFLRSYRFFLPNSLLALFFASLFSSRLTRVRTENSEQCLVVGRYFSSPWTYRSERDDARRRDAIFTKERKRESQNCLFFLLPSFPVSLRLSLYIVW